MRISNRRCSQMDITSRGDGMNRIWFGHSVREGCKVKPKYLVVCIGMALISMLSMPERVLAQTPCSAGAKHLIIYHAGSLSAAFTPVEQLLTAETGICITDVAAGSVDAARRITAGNEPCDIFASADYLDIDRLLKPAGYASYNLLFGQGAMVLAYTTASKGADTITKAGQEFAPPYPIPEVASDWYTQLTRTGVWDRRITPVPGSERLPGRSDISVGRVSV